jgi:hypothetical protein
MAGGVLTFLLAASPASGQTYVGVPPPNVGPVEVGSLSGGTVLGGAAQSVPAVGAAARSAPAVGSGAVSAGALSAANVSAGNLSVAGGQVRIQSAPVRSLAITGGDIAALASIALVSLLIGVVVVRRTRPVSAG